LPDDDEPEDWAAETAPLFDASKRIDTSRFHIVKQLGVGPFGTVYRVQDKGRGTEVALKTLPATGFSFSDGFKEEFGALAALSHENLARLFEDLQTGDQLYFTSYFVEGRNFLEHVRPSSGVDFGQLRSYVAQLAAGLSFLHRAEKLHQDVKPTNVLVTRKGRVALLDYGLLGLEVAELGRTLAASAEYLSPEQARGEALTEASDWYSLGVVLYQALTGRLPFRGTWTELVERRQSEPRAPSESDSRVPLDLSELCMSLLTHEPSRRAGAKEVLARCGEARVPVHRLPSRASGSLFGRQAELEQLELALGRVQAGAGVTVLIDGNSGVGKTALVEHFLTSEAESQDAIVLRGRCYEREQVPYQGIDSLIDDLCRLLHGLDPAVAEGVLPRHLASLVRLFPVLERVPLIARQRELDRSVGTDERDTRRQAFGAFRELLARIADKRLLIVHIDDLQWGDLDTAGLLKEVLKPPDAPFMLLVLAYRREDEEHSPCLRLLTKEPIGNLVPVHLGPLSGDAAMALIQEHLPVKRAQVDVDRLVEEAAGNPFLLHEVVQFATLRKKGANDPEGFDVHAALRSRVDRLPLAALELLQTVAVAGHPIPEAVARRAAAPVGSPAEAWRLLVDEHLVRFSGPLEARLVETFHDRIRETVLASLTAQRARACHRGLAAALEEAGDPDPEVLAQHHRAGRNPERALEFTVLAAEQATQALAFDRGARLLNQALEARELDRVQRARLLVSLGEAYGNAGRCGESARVYEEAAEAAEPEARIPLRRRAASQHLFAGNVNRGRELIRGDLRAQGVPVPQTPGRTLASVVRLRALIRLKGLEFAARESADIPPEALTFLDHLRSVAVVMSFVDVGLGAEIGARFLLRAKAVGDRHFFALGLALLAGHSGVEHPFTARTRYLLERMERECSGSKDASVRGTVTAVQGLCHYFAGDWRRAVQKLDAAEEVLRDCQGFVCELWSSRAVGIWSRFFLGDWEEMARRVFQGLDDARDRGNAYGMAGVCSPFGVSAWLGRGEPEEARRVLHEVTSTWRVEGFQIQDYWFLVAESLVHLSVGDGALAWDQMCTKWKSAAAPLTMRFPANRAQLLHIRGSCALAAADQSKNAARSELLKEAVRVARRLSRVRIPYAQPFAELLWAGVAWRRGAPSEASRLLQSAIAGFEAQQMPVYASAARRRLAQLGGESIADFLPGQRIADADAITRMLVPGLDTGQ